MKSILRTLNIALLMSIPSFSLAGIKDQISVQVVTAQGRRMAPVYPFVATDRTEQAEYIRKLVFYSAVAERRKQALEFLEHNVDPNMPHFSAIFRNIHAAQCQNQKVPSKFCRDFGHVVLGLHAYPLFKEAAIKEFDAELAKLKSELPAEYSGAEVIMSITFKVPTYDNTQAGGVQEVDSEAPASETSSEGASSQDLRNYSIVTSSR